MKRRVGPVLTILVLAVPRLVSAQDAAKPQSGLAPAGFGTVFVVDKGGQEAKGVLIRWDAESFLLAGPDGRQRRYEIADVQRVTRRGDSVKEGAIAGAIVGGLIGLISAGFECGSAAQKFGVFAVSTGFYSLVGAGIDAAIPGRTTIYEAWVPAGAAPGTPRTAKRAGPARIGVGYTVTW